MRRFFSIIIISILFPLSAISQERMGICNSVYSGITGEWINPAFLAGTPFKWDLNLITPHAYIDNNYVYLFQTNIPDYIADDGNTPIVVANFYNTDQGNSSKYMLENKEKSSWNKNIYLNALIQGPSLMVNIKKWTFAFNISGRGALSFTRLNKDGAELCYEGMTYDPLHNIDIPFKKFRMNTAVWEEFGISAAREIKKTRSILIKGGVSLKHLVGLDAAYYLNKSMTLYVPNDSDMYFKNISSKYGYAFGEDEFTSKKGSGKSIDLGVTFEKKTLQNSYQCPNFCNKKLGLEYAWKLGISLIDIGYLKFKENAKTYEIENKTNMWYSFTSIKLDDFSGFDSTLNSHFGDLPIPTAKGNDFTMMLPWALSVQYDYNIGYNFYINGTWVQRIPHFGMPGIDRANIISITPRYDYRRFGIAIPIVLYQYLWPRIGIAVRINNFLFVGTDKIGAFIGNRLSGADIYAGLKINALRKCNKKKNKSFLAF